MADCPTFQDLFRIARDEALSKNSRLTKTIIERAGSDANALVAAGVSVGDAVMGRLIRYQAALYLDTAKGPDLDRLVWDRYKLLRKPASLALGEVQITSATPLVLALTIPIGTVFKTEDGRVYTATEQANFPAGSSGPITVKVQSALAGLSQQAAIGTIKQMELSGAPAGLTVTNAQATAGADDEEKDPSLRDRAKKFYQTSQRGTLFAIERRALDVPGVRTATAIETVEGDATPARLVELVITDQFTEELVDASVLPGSYQSQADLLALTVKSALNDTRAAGIQVVVTIAQISVMGITLLLRFRQGVDVAATADAARATAVAYTNGLAAGSTWDPGTLETLLSAVPGLNVLGGEVVSPNTPQSATTLQAWRTTTANVVIGNI